MQDQVFSEYKLYVSRLPLALNTKRNYLLRVKSYLAWLSQTPDGMKALQDARERDYFVRDFKSYMLQSGRSGATVNAFLGAIDNFYIYLGFGRVKIRRQDLPAQAPRALSKEEQHRLLRAVIHCRSTRNQAMIMLLLHCGLRISELAALNVGDVFVTARKGEVTVRCGKGSKQRKIPMNTELRECMLLFLSCPRDPGAPLFLSQKGSRISTNGIDRMLRQLARVAGIEMSAHRLRHTALSRMIRSGCDIVIVAEVAGHSRLETTRRYSLPTADVKIAAMEKLNYATSS